MRPVVSPRRRGASDDHPGESLPRGRRDPFADLVRQVASDPDNPFNIDRYLWILEEPPPQACVTCGDLFDAWADYLGGPARGLPRRYCSPRCRDRAAWARRRHGVDVDGRWGSAA